MNIIKSETNFEIPPISFAQYLSTEIQRTDKDAIALIKPDSDFQLTFSQFNKKCNKFSSALVDLGVKETDVVVFYADNCIDYAIALIGTIYLGLVFVPVPPAHGSLFELSQQLTQCSATILICGSRQMKTTVMKMKDATEYCQSIEQLKLIVTLDEPEEEPSMKLWPCKAHSMKKILQMNLSESTLPQIPYFPVNDPANSTFLICFTSGFTVVLLPSGDLEPLMANIEKYRISVFTFSGNQARALATGDWEQRFNLKSLKYIRTGGSNVPENLLLAIKEKFKVPLKQVYGSTEFFQAIRVRHPLDTWQCFRPGNVGVPGPNVELKIANLVTGEAMPALAQGEICLRGPACFTGYLNNEAATRSTIDSDGFYHSGDIGFYNEDHCLFITDRIKELIKYKLYSLIPAEIEDFISRHKAVAAVCIVGVPHSIEGSYIRAYVEVAPGKTLTEQQLIDYVSENMGSQKRLRAGVRFISAMPQTLIGKIDRQHFKRLVKDELLTEIVE
ncbi:PREDICTED: luciferin 4-monooxygenase-like [Rhagoletis zephyria]|uniref:luciferin 4-monooxygenase-like n=1 Tax=Rhagoletis zephyria TaxID=28612 RepID=UPI00081148CB|nr:PREDICTED: luciferin 4-monooxygenase-like [Rhagoletis zephyria]